MNNQTMALKSDVTLDLVSELSREITGEVSVSKLRRAQYSTDASNYRVIPQAVVIPRSIDEVRAVLAYARKNQVPITPRGAGTSVAGNAIGPGIVIDFSKHLNKIHHIDPQARTALIDPGVIMGNLQKATVGHKLRFGPDPSTTSRATLGGMIGNNACGPHAVAYGRTVDNVVDLQVVDGLGREFTARGGDSGFLHVPGLSDLVLQNLALIRTEFGRFGRQVSGYSLEHLLPEMGSNLAKMLVGTEGSLVTILGATVNLVPLATAPVLVCLGYEDMASAADDVPNLLTHKPLAIEGLDAKLVDVVKRAKGENAVPTLPPGAGWLMVEVGANELEVGLQKAQEIVASANTDAAVILPPGPEATAMWQIRADGAGLAGRTPSGNQAWPGWEDAAVPPEKLGSYLRDFESLMADYGVEGLPFGHFGDGCIHVRIDVPLEKDGNTFRSFIHDCAKLVTKYGGSLSGEHGDGRARGELLPYMYTPAALNLFEQVKELFDPENLLNPGVIVKPDAIDDNLRRPQAPLTPASDGFAFIHDEGDLSKAVHRCVGVGKCRADNTGAGGFMCPSYQATQDEKDVTRGRARVLQETINGKLITGSWKSPELHQALDLCLSCKACSRDCPAGVDMATYKSEVLHRTYQGRIRPITHYLLGWLPRWTKLVSAVPGVALVANTALKFRPLAKAVLWFGGMDPRRKLVTFTGKPFRHWAHRKSGLLAQQQQVSQSGILKTRLSGEQVATQIGSVRQQVVLWTDSFSDSLAPQVPMAAVKVLQNAGYDVIIPDQEDCCGLTWITTGQLTAAKGKLSKLLDGLAPFAVNGIPIIGLEPSCTAVLRSDLVELLPDDPRAVQVSRAVMTLAELLSSPYPLGPDPQKWSLPDLSGVTAVVQPHCHHHSVMGFKTDEQLLTKAGAKLKVLSGCCGLAGNFGMEKGHYEVSVKVAEKSLLPALAAAQPGEVYLADGFSCRTQASHLAEVDGITLAQLLASKLEQDPTL